MIQRIFNTPIFGLMLLSSAFISACDTQEMPSAPPPTHTLAKVAALSIAGENYHFPIVAISWGGSSKVTRRCGPHSTSLCTVSIEELESHSSSSKLYLPVTGIGITLSNYENYRDKQSDGYVAIPELCELLTKDWAKQQCKGPSIFRDNLRDFHLIEEESLDQLAIYIADSGKTAGSIAEAMHIQGKDPTYTCVPNGQNLCVAALRISRKVIAVWVLANEDSEVISLQRQANAIRALIKYGAGESENLDLLIHSVEQGRVN